jgi:ABC-2 type transport system ATP-binding protein
MDIAINVQHLRRIYNITTGVLNRQAKEVEAIKDVTFDIKAGELLGLLGPNGAGKTTTVKMLTTLLIPTSGSASILGHDVVRDAQAIRGKIGFIFGGERGLYWRLSAYDNLRYFATLYRLDPDIAKQRIPYLIEMVGLSGREHEKIEGYSRGMKQRPLDLIRSLPANCAMWCAICKVRRKLFS